MMQTVWKWQKVALCIAALFVFSFFSFSSQAQDKILKVGVALGPPFAEISHQEYYGIAVDIWKQLAEELNLKYQFVALNEQIDDDIKQLAAGKIDVLIGPIVPTYMRMKQVDFLDPYYVNQISLVVPAKGLSFINALSSIFTDVTKAALLILLAFTLLYFHVYWYFELRKQNQAYHSYWRGILDTCWMHTLDIDMSDLPTHVLTRLSRFIWLVLITIFFSSITASITSSLTVALSGQYESSVSLDAFKDKKVAAVQHAAPYDIAKSIGFSNLLTVNDRAEAVRLVLNGDAAAFVDYYPVAEHYLITHQLTHQLTMTNLVLERDTFAFALPVNSPLRHALNLKLRSKQEDGGIKLICENHFNHSEKAAMNCDL